MKKVLRMNETEIQEMRDQIKKEADTDPMDGGIVVPDGGDGIQRIPVDVTGMPVDPEMDASDRARMAVGMPPEGEGEGEESPEEEPVEDDKEFHVKKGKK